MRPRSIVQGFCVILIAGLSFAAYYRQLDLGRIRGWLQGQPLNIGGQDASIEAYLSALEIPQPSAAVRTALIDLPPESAILFIGPNHEPFFISTYYAISYLSWPRKVWVLGCAPPGQTPGVAILPAATAKIAGVIFYLQPPPSGLPQGRRIGPRLTLVSLPGAFAEKPTWTSYCSP